MMYFTFAFVYQNRELLYPRVPSFADECTSVNYHDGCVYWLDLMDTNLENRSACFAVI